MHDNDLDCQRKLQAKKQLVRIIPSAKPFGVSCRHYITTICRYVRPNPNPFHRTIVLCWLRKEFSYIDSKTNNLYYDLPHDACHRDWRCLLWPTVRVVAWHCLPLQQHALPVHCRTPRVRPTAAFPPVGTVSAIR